MNSKIYKRIKEESDYILKENLTVREIAKKINVSKSTVHKDLFNKVDKILQKHLEVRHINGGYATKIKYEKLRKG